MIRTTTESSVPGNARYPLTLLGIFGVWWAATLAFGGDLGQAYLGTQGDVWDAQADMALAMAGSVLAMALLMLLRRRRARPR